MENPEMEPTLDTLKRPKRMGWPLLLKLSLGLAVLGAILYSINFNEIDDTLFSLNPWYLLPLVALFYLDRWLMAYKWRPLLRVLNVHVPLFVLFRIYLTSLVAGILLPSTIGGDVFRVYGLSRYRVNPQAALASIISERAIGFAAMLVLVAISLVLGSYLMRGLWERFAIFGWLTVAVTLAVGAMTAGAFIFSGERTERLIRRLTPKLILVRLIQLWNLLWEYQDHKSTLAWVSGWTLLEQLFHIAVAYLLVHAMDIDVSFLELTAIIPLVVLAARIPISIEGFGVQEGLYVGLLALVGVNPAEALLLSLITRALYLICALPWAIHFLLVTHRTLPLAIVEQH